MAKVIAVFADGTGNSAAKLFKTNVWRLYDALDTSDPGDSPLERQIAYYHDGVGTSSFKPLAIAGGAFGWGLKRNVLDLYTFICRNYRDGDRICAFGFSRGAFTVRLLAGLIAEQGLVVNTSERDLETYARDAYRRFRRTFDQTGGLVKPLRNLRDLVITGWRKLTRRNTYKAQTTVHPNHDVEIEFVGVWDTVAAYGMPIAEITRGIDDWVWPLSMPDYVLSPKVKRARHALALDDERDTFHPLIWDERTEEDPDRIKQVWFAGMHSDVGGGYPDDSLAYVSLDWMLTEARGAELRFQKKAVDEIQRMMNANGALHDSRRGVGAYYRYQPRKLGARVQPPDPTTLLMQDPTEKTHALLKSVKIHDSVFRRIQQGTDRYAPIVLPRAYTIVSTNGATNPKPVEENPDRRAREQERVWDRVWKRRINYFVTVGFSAYLVLLPLWHVFWPPSACAGPQCMLIPVIRAAGSVVPAIAQSWVDALAAAPGRSAAILIVIALLIGRSKKLQTESRDDMRVLWKESMRLSGAATAPKLPNRFIRKLRQHPAYQRFFQSLKWTVLPVVFGWLILGIATLLVAVLLTMTVLRVGIWRAESSNAWCEPAQGDFKTSSKCWPLPAAVRAETRYRITVTVDAKDPWRDKTIDTSPEGFSLARMGLPGNLLAPLRRSLSAQWFQPLVKIVPDKGGFAMVPLEMQRADTARSSYTAQFTAPKSGRAYFFVNDVLLPSWVPSVCGFGPNSFYENNHGTATIEIERVGD